VPGPLQGIRVLDVGLLVQGPQAGALLSDMGADVIKVELPGFGDHSRLMPMTSQASFGAYFIGCNRGKRSLTLDLRQTEGAEIFRDLAGTADIVLSNFKPGTLEAWGLGYEALTNGNPRIIWAAASTFGPVGADSKRKGADLAGQAAGGLISTIGQDGEPPSPVGATIADHIGSLNLAAGILAALHARQHTGRGQKVEVSLLGGQIWAQASEYTAFLRSGEMPGRANRGHPLLLPTYRVVQTANGWLALIGVAPDAFDAFCIALDRPDLALEERLLPEKATLADFQWLVEEIEPIFKTRTTEEWALAFGDADIRYAPVRDYQQVVDDPACWENGYFAELQASDGTMQRVVGTPIRMSDTPLTPSADAPTLGEHTDEILQRAGYTNAEIDELRTAGTV